MNFYVASIVDSLEDVSERLGLILVFV